MRLSQMLFNFNFIRPLSAFQANSAFFYLSHFAISWSKEIAMTRTMQLFSVNCLGFEKVAIYYMSLFWIQCETYETLLYFFVIFSAFFALYSNVKVLFQRRWRSFNLNHKVPVVSNFQLHLAVKMRHYNNLRTFKNFDEVSCTVDK